jgi:hypothetical protein
MNMRTVLVLAALVFSIVSPLKIHIPHSDGDGHVLALDVCSAAGNVLSLNVDMPVIHECPCKICLLGFAGFYSLSKPLVIPFFLPFQQDRPPRTETYIPKS